MERVLEREDDIRLVELSIPSLYEWLRGYSIERELMPIPPFVNVRVVSTEQQEVLEKKMMLFRQISALESQGRFCPLEAIEKLKQELKELG